MKRVNIISFIAILLSFVGLCLLRFTGMTAHIIISVIALAVMIICTVADRKNWKIPALEIAYRAAYFITLISGVVMVTASVPAFVGIVHKIIAAVFVILYIVTFAVSKKR